MPEEHNPWESGLKERQQKEKADTEAQEARARDEALAKARAEAEHRAALEAAAPKPSISAAEFAKTLHAAGDTVAKVDLLKTRGAQLFKEGFPMLAADAYTAQLALQPSHQAYSNRSACRCTLREYEGALADAEACVSHAPDWAKGYARLGAALHGLYRWPEAIKAYERGLAVDPSLQALKQGIEDARQRLAQAGGVWTIAVDGKREVESQTREGPRRLPQLTQPFGLCAVPTDEAQIGALDGDQIKLFSRHGIVSRTFNEKYKDSGVTSLGDVTGFACDGASMFVAEIYKGRPRIQRLLVADSRSVGCKKEAPDKVLASVTARERELSEPRGVAIVDTSRMGGGLEGDRTLYVCEAALGRVLALDPKELTERFSVGQPGSGVGELERPVAVAAFGDLLAVADAGGTTHRISIFTLRGTFQRHIGEKPSKFSAGSRPGQFVRPPHSIAMAEGPVLFVLEEGGSRVHVINPETGEPQAMLFPPYNLSADGTEGALKGLCVNDIGLYVSSAAAPVSKILCLPRAR